MSLSSAPSWLAVNGLTLTGTPSNDDVGTSNVIVNLTDGELITSTTFVLTVNAVNDPPIATSQSVELNEDESINILVYGNDEDSDDLDLLLLLNTQF